MNYYKRLPFKFSMTFKSIKKYLKKWWNIKLEEINQREESYTFINKLAVSNILIEWFFEWFGWSVGAWKIFFIQLIMGLVCVILLLRRVIVVGHFKWNSWSLSVFFPPPECNISNNNTANYEHDEEKMRKSWSS